MPLVLAHYDSAGLKWGLNAFHNSLRKIDEINDAASLINDQVRKSVNLMWYFAGVRQSSELSASAGDKDKVPAIYAPEDSQPYPMVGNLPIADALSNLQNMLMELERDMPELALQRIRENGNLTAPGVRTGYSDAIGNIQNARKNLDPALVAAMQMAVSIGAFNRYDGFGAFTLDSYARGDLDFDIRERPVIGDSLSKQEKITALASVGDKPPSIQKLILRELDYADKDIEEVVADTMAAQAKAQQQTPQGATNSPEGFADLVSIWERLGLDDLTNGVNDDDVAAAA